MLTMEMIREAQERLRGVARVTPLNGAKTLGRNVYMKAENLQLTGAFKLRGAYNKLCTLTEEERARGVIACSAGNHAQGVALSAARLGIRSVICMPAGAPISKVEATKNYGAKVVLVIAGQGTIGLEILEQLPEADQVVVPIGGGGLISGVAYAIKNRKPSCRVIGVQAAGAASMYTSRQAGEVLTLPSVATIADGIAVKRPRDLTFALCQQYVDDIVTVRDDEIAAAILALLEDQKTVAEGAGAVSVAAVMFGKVDLVGKNTVCVVSGGNVDVTTLSRIITKGLSKTGRITEFTVKIADKPGSLVQLLQTISKTGANILSVNHAREDKHSDIGACVVSMVLETRNRQHVDDIERELQSFGYHILEK